MSSDLIDEKAKLVEQVYGRVPFSHNIKNLDLQSEARAIRFDWYGSRYRVTVGGSVEEVLDGMLAGNDKSTLMQALIQGFLP